MSYKAPKAEDSLTEFMLREMDFLKLKKHMEQAKDFTTFIRWFEKLQLINPRAAFLWIQDNEDKYDPEWIECAKSHFIRKTPEM